MPAVPQTIANDLLERLERFVSTDTKPTQFEERLFDRDANALQKIDRSAAELVRAGMAALRWDVEDMHRSLETACALDPSETTFFNAAITCRVVNAFEDVVRYIQRASEVAPNEERLTAELWSTYMTLGELDKAKVYAQKGYKQGDIREQIDRSLRLLSDIEKLPVPDPKHLIKQESRIIVETLSAAHKRVRELAHVLHHDPDGGLTLVLMVSFTGTLEDEFELEEALSARLIELPDWNPEYIAVECQHVEHDALQCA